MKVKVSYICLVWIFVCGLSHIEITVGKSSATGKDSAGDEFNSLVTDGANPVPNPAEGKDSLEGSKSDESTGPLADYVKKMISKSQHMHHSTIPISTDYMKVKKARLSVASRISVEDITSEEDMVKDYLKRCDREIPKDYFSESTAEGAAHRQKLIFRLSQINRINKDESNQLILNHESCSIHKGKTLSNFISEEGIKKEHIAVTEDTANLKARRGVGSTSSSYLYTYPSVEALPKTVDWTQHGAVSPVKNQEDCGACYSFAVAAAIEGANFIQTQILSNYSVQQLISCSKVTGNMGCNGGNFDNSYRYLIHKAGSTPDGVNGRISVWAASPYGYPFDLYGSFHNTVSCNMTGVSSYSGVTSSVDVSANAAAMQAVVSTQPLPTAIDGSTVAFQAYQDGVLTSKECQYSGNVNHAVLIVGYGILNGVKYWKIKNSWGTGWGQSGFALVERGTNACGIEVLSSYPVVDEAFAKESQPNDNVNRMAAVTVNSSSANRPEAFGSGVLCGVVGVILLALL